MSPLPPLLHSSQEILLALPSKHIWNLFTARPLPCSPGLRPHRLSATFPLSPLLSLVLAICS